MQLVVSMLNSNKLAYLEVINTLFIPYHNIETLTVTNGNIYHCDCYIWYFQLSYSTNIKWHTNTGPTSKQM